MDWFLYDNDLRPERVKHPQSIFPVYLILFSKSNNESLYFTLHQEDYSMDRTTRISCNFTIIK